MPFGAARADKSTGQSFESDGAGLVPRQPYDRVAVRHVEHCGESPGCGRFEVGEYRALVTRRPEHEPLTGGVTDYKVPGITTSCSAKNNTQTSTSGRPGLVPHADLGQRAEVSEPQRGRGALAGHLPMAKPLAWAVLVGSGCEQWAIPMR